MSIIRKYRNWMAQQRRFWVSITGSALIVAALGAIVGAIISFLNITVVFTAVAGIIAVVFLVYLDYQIHENEKLENRYSQVQEGLFNQTQELQMHKARFEGSAALTIVQPDVGSLSLTDQFAPSARVFFTWCQPKLLSFSWFLSNGEAVHNEILVNKADHLIVAVVDGQIKFNLTPYTVYESVVSGA